MTAVAIIVAACIIADRMSDSTSAINRLATAAEKQNEIFNSRAR